MVSGDSGKRGRGGEGPERTGNNKERSGSWESEHYVPPRASFHPDEDQVEFERFASEESKIDPDFAESGFDNPRYDERGERTGWDYRRWLQRHRRHSRNVEPIRERRERIIEETEFVPHGAKEVSCSPSGVKTPQGYQRPDYLIEDSICEYLARDPMIDASKVRVEVHQGDVLLTGTVPATSMVLRAARVVDEVFGVRSLRNEIRPESKSEPK